jgi:hypothetical protein
MSYASTLERGASEEVPAAAEAIRATGPMHLFEQSKLGI